MATIDPYAELSAHIISAKALYCDDGCGLVETSGYGDDLDAARELAERGWVVRELLATPADQGEPTELDRFIGAISDPLYLQGYLQGYQNGYKHAEAERDELEHRLACLLCELTGGRMSGTNYDVPTMVQEVEAHFERTVDDDVTELRAIITDAGLETYTPDGSERVAAHLTEQQRTITELRATVALVRVAAHEWSRSADLGYASIGDQFLSMLDGAGEQHE